ncbi:MAG: flavin reductase [Thermomicrobiales bacterium]|nr:flavin reductase [Thermomicrobiales bacterium]
MTLDPAAKKAVLRSFTYGLYAVSASDGNERGIFTANWLTQVSFDPPMVAVSVELDSSTLGVIRRSGQFAVSPLRSGQRDLAGSLGRPRSKAGDKVAALGDAVVRTESGCLAYAAGLGYLVCRVTAEAPAGDSVLIVGEVIEAVAGKPGEPLTMKDAGFRHFG